MEDNRNICGGDFHKLNGNTLKWIALLSMLIDHIGIVFFAGGSHSPFSLYSLCRYIGRISFPIFCFLLVEGFCHTRDVKKYLRRLFVFACIAEIPFDLAIYGKIVKLDGQNVLFTFTIALALLAFLRQKEMRDITWWIALVSACAVAYVFRVDYECVGIVLITVLYYFRNSHWQRNSVAGAILLWEPTALLALPLVECYNGQRGRGSKYFFYWFYPLHLLVLSVLVRL